MMRVFFFFEFWWFCLNVDIISMKSPRVSTAKTLTSAGLGQGHAAQAAWGPRPAVELIAYQL